MTRISSITGGFSGYASVSRSFAGGGGSEYSGSTMLFVQTAAPTGWTKETSYDDYALRVTSGTTTTGGTVGFSSIFTTITPSGTVSPITVSSIGSVTLSTPQLPQHNHTYTQRKAYQWAQGSLNVHVANFGLGFTTAAVGGGLSHTHTNTSGEVPASFSGTGLNLGIKYVDAILATRN